MTTRPEPTPRKRDSIRRAFSTSGLETQRSALRPKQASLGVRPAHYCAPSMTPAHDAAILPLAGRVAILSSSGDTKMDDLDLRQNILDELEYEPRVDAADIGVD